MSINKPPTPKAENVLFTVKMTEEQIHKGEDIENPIEEEKKYFHPKLEFIATQLPLDSISEDVNSPYFASSPSNVTAIVRRQSTPGKNKPDGVVEPKFSSTLDNNEQGDIMDKNLAGGGTFQTTTTVSDNFIENANLDTLEQKLEKIMNKRTRRIEVFESYLNEWEKEKFNKEYSSQLSQKPHLQHSEAKAKGVKCKSKNRNRNSHLKGSRTARPTSDRKPSRYWIRESGNLIKDNILSPVLKSGHGYTRHK